jgi:3-methyladenine DNA glycosylase/8-oxoguanine DNA glycosylase
VLCVQFPSPDDLASASEEDLRDLGVGYRAKFLIGSARIVIEVRLTN